MKTIVIVGAGPAGIMAAIQAKTQDNEVILIEKNKRIGQKLSLTGGGRCNITSLVSKEEFFEKIPNNAKFFYSAFSAFSNYDCMDFLEKQGIDLRFEGEKVYPKNQSAQKLVNRLEEILQEKSVQIKLQEEVIDFRVDEGKRVRKLITNKGEYRVDFLVVATGGCSYCKNNTFSLLEKKGIAVTSLYPSLVAIETLQDYSILAGISLKDVVVRAKIQGKYRVLQGDILFTDTGLSGPAVLDISSYLVKTGVREIEIDFLPTLSKEGLERELKGRGKKSIKNKMAQFLPQRLAQYLFEEFETIDVHNMKKEAMERCIAQGKKFIVKIKTFSPMKRAIVTKGGVDVREIVPSTMESKKIENLYFAGECIDLDALTGGYNLQIAFSTGYLCGKCIGKK